MEDYVKKGVTPEMLKGTKTEQNLHTALAAESQACLRYHGFEKKVKNIYFTNSIRKRLVITTEIFNIRCHFKRATR